MGSEGSDKQLQLQLPSPALGAMQAPLAFASTREALQAFNSRAKAAVAVCMLAETHERDCLLDRAFSLYIRALNAFHFVLFQAKEWLRQEEDVDPLGVMLGGSSLRGTDADTALRDLTQWLATQFRKCMGRAAVIRQRLADSKAARMSAPAPSAAFTDTPCVEKLVYDGAMKFAKEAAVDELMNKREDAEQKYKLAGRLLESLYSDDLEEHDRLVLQQFIKEFNRRKHDVKARPRPR